MPKTPMMQPAARRWLVLVALLALGAGACARSSPEHAPLRIAAAASLQQVVKELALAFGEQQGTQVRINCAASNALAKQIQAAGQTDLFLSADSEWVAYLAQKNCVWENTQKEFLSNRLVVIAHASRAAGPERLEELVDADFKHLALANPRSVPAGRYAMQMLASIKLGERSLWDALEARVAPCLDVRAALAMVEAHPEVLGIVYTSEAVRSHRVQRLIEIPEALQPGIVYSAVLIRNAEFKQEPNPVAREFLAFLSSPTALAVYQANGFEQEVPNPAGSK